MLAGLAYGARQGIVHRDLKPENLLVAADGRVKIADFGVARAYNAAAPRAVVTATGTTIGTPAYMAPEQALGEELTPATDLYSLGIVAWEMFTGAVPFESTGTPVAVLYRQVHEPVPPVREIDPDIDERLAVWLDRMLAKRPDGRFASADAAWEELEDIVIELLGPRWRREARLGTDPPAPDRHPLTPAEFESVEQPAAPPAEPGGPITPTETPLVPGAAGHTTILRPGRRHSLPDEPDAPPAQARSWPRATIAAMLAAAVVAAAIGVLIGTSGGGGSSTSSSTAASKPPAATVDGDLGPVLQTLAGARATGLANVKAANTAAQQAAAATTIAGAFSTAAERVAAVPGSPASLHTTLTDLASSYQALAAAARAKNRAKYQQVATQIGAQEQQLRTEAASL